MARFASAAQMKGQGTCPTQNQPRPNTQIRAVYDLLQSHKAIAVQISAPNLGAVLTQLRDVYGLDIRTVQDSREGLHGRLFGKSKVPTQYMLVGEWFGKNYQNYLSNVSETTRPLVDDLLLMKKTRGRVGTSRPAKIFHQIV
jgi:hypothetical protein